MSGKTAVVSLPPDWLQGNDLGPSDQVEIWYNGEIRARPKRKAREVNDGPQVAESPPA
jgi:antitoxin component of MazEF toxin-antitoxin module